jgi:hypothetical protein
MDTCAYGQHFQGRSNPPAVCQIVASQVLAPGGRMDFKNTVSDSQQCHQHSTLRNDGQRGKYRGTRRYDEFPSSGAQ